MQCGGGGWEVPDVSHVSSFTPTSQLTLHGNTDHFLQPAPKLSPRLSQHLRYWQLSESSLSKQSYVSLSTAPPVNLGHGHRDHFLHWAGLRWHLSGPQ